MLFIKSMFLFSTCKITEKKRYNKHLKRNINDYDAI